MKPTRKPHKPDFILSIPIVILIGFGMVMVYSASGVQSMELYGDSGMIFFKQFVALGVGFVAMMITLVIPHHFYRRKSVLFPSIFVIALLLFGVTFQSAVKGASRWYYIGPFGFQPSDVAKLFIIVFVAVLATAYAGHPNVWKKRLSVIIPVLAIFCTAIALQTDFGSIILILGIVSVMLFLAGLPMRILALGGLLMLPFLVGLLLTKSYRIQRIKDFMFSEHYQTRQAKLAIGSGGLTGLGLAKGKQKLYYLPEPHTDFIFATLCEEFGFLGATTVLFSYLFFLFRGAVVLKRVESDYSKILGAGLLLFICIQAYINISITLNLLPNKGLTLPFMSAGGTSLIIFMAMFGMLLNISRWQVVGNRLAV